MFFMYFVVDMEKYNRVRCTRENFAAAVLFGGSRDAANSHWARYKAEGKVVRVLSGQGEDVTPLLYKRSEKRG